MLQWPKNIYHVSLFQAIKTPVNHFFQRWQWNGSFWLGKKCMSEWYKNHWFKIAINLASYEYMVLKSKNKCPGQPYPCY